MASFTNFLLQAGHRAAIVATLVLSGAVLAVLFGSPADTLAWVAIVAADVAIVLAGFLLIRAYRATRRDAKRQVHDHATVDVDAQMRRTPQSISLLLFGLLIAHAAGYLLLTHFESISAWREQPMMQVIFHTERK